MTHVLIYDTASSHHNTVKATVEHYATASMTFHRQYYGFQGPWYVELLDYCLANDVQIVVIPYSSVGYNGYELAKEGILAVKPRAGNLEYFTGFIQVAGGVNEAENCIHDVPGLDFYGESDNFSGSARVLPSWFCGKVAGLAVDLIEAGYTIWQTRQILRQNCDAYNSFSNQDGFGKLPDTITVPGALDAHPPVNVHIEPITSSSLNPGLGVLWYNAPGDAFTFDDGGAGINAASSPYVIEGGNRQYTLSFDTEYGSEFASIAFNLGAYTPTAIPKKVEVFYFKNSFGNRRFLIGNASTSQYIPEEREGDRIEYRIYNAEDVLLFQGFSKWNKSSVLLEPYNNPDFSLQNGGGAVYTFQFRFVNEYGEGEWSNEVDIIDDNQDRSEAFDFRVSGNGNVEPDPDPPEGIPDSRFKSVISLRNVIVEIDGESLFSVDSHESVDIDVSNFKTLSFKKITG